MGAKALELQHHKVLFGDIEVGGTFKDRTELTRRGEVPQVEGQLMGLLDNALGRHQAA